MHSSTHRSLFGHKSSPGAVDESFALLADKPRTSLSLPELSGHDRVELTVHLSTLTKSMQVTASLAHYGVPGHRLTQGVEEHHQFVDVHVSVHGPLTVHGHDGHTDEQVERGRLVVCPASLPDGQGVFFGELSLETDE